MSTNYKNWETVIDISLWQPKINADILKAGGVRMVIAKASTGNGADPRWAQHAAEVRRAGLILGAYHWCDPIQNAEAQAQRFLDTVTDSGVRALFLDVEQWWSNWGTWYDAMAKRVEWAAVKAFAPRVISENARRIAAYLTARTDLPVVIYSSLGFVNGHAADMATWMGAYPFWLARYVFSGARETITWADVAGLKAQLSPTAPVTPAGAGRLVGWQYSGDKHMLPGVYADEMGNRLSTLDLNVFDPAWLAQISGGELPTPETPAQPESATLRGKVTGAVLNVRTGPGVNYPVASMLRQGEVVPVLGVAGADAWIKISDNPARWVCAQQNGTRLVDVK